MSWCHFLFPFSEHYGGQDYANEDEEEEEVCKIFQYIDNGRIILELLLCYMLVTVLIASIEYDTNILNSAVIHVELKALNLLQPLKLENEEDDEKKRTWFRQNSNKVTCVS